MLSLAKMEKTGGETSLCGEGNKDFVLAIPSADTKSVVGYARL